MLPRFGVGAAVAALPGAAAITGAAAGWCPWVIAAFAVFALIAAFVVPPAPYLPVLNRVPLIGSPKFKIVLRLNGRLLNTRVRIDDWSNTSVLEVGILNQGRSAPVRDASMNLLVPSGVQMGRCDKVGRHIKGGRWEPFHPHPLGSHARSDYWNDAGWTFEPGLSRLVRVKLRFSPTQPGEYPVLFKLDAPSLYQELEVDGTIYVEDVPGGDLGSEDQMGALITEGEQLYREWDMGGAEEALTGRDAARLRRDVLAYLIKVEPVITDAIGDDRLPQAPDDADRDALLVRVREALDALYVVRDERGQQADPEDSD